MHNDLPYNFVRLTGNLGADPVVKGSKENPVAKFDIAVTTGKDDRKKTNWFPCVCFGDIASAAEQQLQKGSRIILEGRLSMDSWQTKEGQNRRRAEVIVNEFEVQERREGSSAVPEAESDDLDI